MNITQKYGVDDLIAEADKALSMRLITEAYFRVATKLAEAADRIDRYVRAYDAPDKGHVIARLNAKCTECMQRGATAWQTDPRNRGVLCDVNDWHEDL